MKEKVGVAVVTYNRPDYLKNLLDSLVACYDVIDELIVVNDGDHVKYNLEKGTWVDNPVNLGVGKTKNLAIKHLLAKECDYIFVLEDDIIIKDKEVFNQYIKASKTSGIQHFNFGPGTPFNRKQEIRAYDLHNRHELSNKSIPTPRLTIDYKDIKVDLYEHCAGLFSFFTTEILNTVGLHDEAFLNAWEHVDHTYRIIQEKGHPPFWWFADINRSVDYLHVQEDALKESSTSKNKEQWFENIRKGREIYRDKHGFYPNMAPQVSKEEVIQILKEVKQKWKI